MRRFVLVSQVFPPRHAEWTFLGICSQQCRDIFLSRPWLSDKDAVLVKKGVELPLRDGGRRPDRPHHHRIAELMRIPPSFALRVPFTQFCICLYINT